MGSRCLFEPAPNLSSSARGRTRSAEPRVSRAGRIGGAAAWSKVRDGRSSRSCRLGALMPRSPFRPALRRALLIAAVAAIAAPLAGCNDFGDVTGSISGSTPPADETRLRAYADDCGKRYERNPGEKIASIEYARALRV